MKGKKHLNIIVVLVFEVLLVSIGIPNIGTASNYELARIKADSIDALINSDDVFSEQIDSITTLDDYLVIAMKHNPGLKSSYYRWISELKKSDYVGGLPDPMFSYGYFIENVETRVGPQEHRFSLKQAFPWFGTLGAKKDMAFATSQAMYQKFESERLKLFYQVKSAYYEYYYIGQDLEVTQANFELLKFWEAVARAKYKVGLEPHPDVIKAQVELGKLEDRIKTLEEQIDPAAAKLRALLNLDRGVVLPIPTSVDVEEEQLNEDSTIKIVKNNNPNLLALAHIVEKEEAGVRLASKSALPNFTIGIDYIQTGEAKSAGLPESGKDPWMINAGLSLPIWFGKNNARKKEARARQIAAEYLVQDTENQLIAYTEAVLFEYSNALRKLKLYRDGLVPKAEQSLNASYASYQAGETDFLNVLDAQRQLLDFELIVAKEKVTLARKRAELEMLNGQEIIEQ